MTRLEETVVLLDFDGTLAPIVPRPADARPLPGVASVLRDLVRRAAAVVIVTGRPSATIEAFLGPIDGLRIAGLYGFEGAPPLPPPVVELVRAVAGAHPGCEVEPKGASVAVHYRNAPDPDATGLALRPQLDAVAVSHGLRVIAGKKVWELAPADAGGKGEAVDGILARLSPAAVIYAGDDVADLEAFSALDRSGLPVRKVAVLGDETPVVLREAADVVVEGPAGLLEMLRRL